MIDSTAHIDPHWPADVAAFAQEQPPLLDVGPAYCAHREPTAGGFCPDCETSVSLKIETPAPPFAGLTISKSEIAVLRRCPRRYFFEYVLGRTPAAGSGIAAEWGTALHRGLEALYRTAQTDDGEEAALTFALEDATRAGTDTDGRPYAPPADPYARAALRAMLRAYAAVWGPDDAARYEVLAVELPFDLPVLTAEGRVSRGRREGARREGRIDAIVREREERGPDPVDAQEIAESGLWAEPDPKLWIVEHKSTGKPPAEDRFYLGVDLELQTALYYDAARELGYQPAGVLYDVIRRPDFDDPKPPPQRNKDGSERKAPSIECTACAGNGNDWSEDGAVCRGKCNACDGVGRVSKQVAYTNPRHGEPAAVYEERVYQLAINKPGDFFHRRALTIEPWQIEEAREDVRAAALEIAWRTRSGAWPRVGDRYVCAARGMVCPWIDVCGRRSSAEDDRLFPLKRKKEIENT